jgi:hypothetical protein
MKYGWIERGFIEGVSERERERRERGKREGRERGKKKLTLLRRFTFTRISSPNSTPKKLFFWSKIFKNVFFIS